MESLFYRYWKSIAITVFVLFLSFFDFAPTAAVPRFTMSDKVMHLILYLIFGLVLMIDQIWGRNKTYTKRRFLMWTVIFPIVLGGLAELTQHFFFYPRQAEWLDWAGDVVGVLIAWVIFKYIYIRKMENNKQ